jgi:hypothetical protein
MAQLADPPEHQCLMLSPKSSSGRRARLRLGPAGRSPSLGPTCRYQPGSAFELTGDRIPTLDQADEVPACSKGQTYPAPSSLEGPDWPVSRWNDATVLLGENALR